jgi:hypothetical protein
MINASILPEIEASAKRLLDGTFIPLSDDLLRRYDFFSLYPPDVIGKSDQEFSKQIIRTHAIEAGRLPHIDWRQYERWRTVEHSCILNRMYFIMPLARYCWLTKNKPLGRLVVDTMLDFIHSCPPPASADEIVRHMKRTLHIQHHDYNLKTFDEIQKDETDIRYVWFDFQPASRLMHFLYALHFLRDSSILTPKEQRTIVRSIYEHAEVIYYGEMAAPLVIGDNHQSTRATALMMAAAFFQDKGGAFLKEASRIIRFHSRECFFPDGVLKEISPSYHTSVTWHVRACYFLAEKLGAPLGAEVNQQLCRATAYIQALTAPNDRTVVINDGREVNPEAWLAALAPFQALQTSRRENFFPDAGIASLQWDRLFLAVDGSTFTGAISHYQSGKNGLILWVNGRPFLVDSGCPDLYDDELLSKWYRLPQAHSTLLVNDQGDGTLKGFTEFDSHADIQSTGWQARGQDVQITNTLTSTASQWRNLSWTRQVNVSPSASITIRDTVECDRPVLLTFIFNLHYAVAIQILDSQKVLLRNGDYGLGICFSTGSPMYLKTAAGKIYALGSHHDSEQLLLEVRCDAHAALSTTIRPLTEVGPEHHSSAHTNPGALSHPRQLGSHRRELS